MVGTEKEINGIKFLNVTPHPITLAGPEGEEPTVLEPSGFIASAKAVEAPAGEKQGLSLVKTTFVGDKETEAQIDELLANDIIVIGSIIAAQAYPGKVFAMVPCKGFERVPPQEKRMRWDKFTTFA